MVVVAAVAVGTGAVEHESVVEPGALVVAPLVARPIPDGVGAPGGGHAFVAGLRAAVIAVVVVIVIVEVGFVVESVVVGVVIVVVDFGAGALW